MVSPVEFRGLTLVNTGPYCVGFIGMSLVNTIIMPDEVIDELSIQKKNNRKRDFVL